MTNRPANGTRADKRLGRIGIATGLLLLAPQAVAQTIVNGDMNGVADFQIWNAVVPPGWTSVSGSTDLFDFTTTIGQAAWQPNVGGAPFVHGFGFWPNGEALGQVVTGLTVGVDYEIQFEQTISYEFGSNTSLGFWEVSFGNDVQDSTQMATPPPGFSVPWQAESMIFTATATSQLLVFWARPVDTSTFPWKIVFMGLDTVEIAVFCPTTPGFEFVRAGTPPNPLALLPGISGPPVIGTAWDPIIDHTSFVPAAVLDFYAFSLFPANISAPPLGTILCTPPLFTLTAPPGTPLNLFVPGNCVLADFRLCVSGASLDSGGSVFLTNALDVVIGGI